MPRYRRFFAEFRVFSFSAQSEGNNRKKYYQYDHHENHVDDENVRNGSDWKRGVYRVGRVADLVLAVSTVEISLAVTKFWYSFVFPVGENVRDAFASVGAH